MSGTSNEAPIIVPEMVNLDSLTKIVIAYEKAGASQKEVSTEEVAQISGIATSNVGINNKFFVSIGLLEGKRGGYKLTPLGSEYAKALDWGRLEEAQSVLRKIIKDKPLVQKVVSYVELNKPVQKDDLIAKIAIFANVPNQQRFSTGIKAFVEMLTLSKILQETEGALIPVPREESKEAKSEISIVEAKNSEKGSEYENISDFFDSYLKRGSKEPSSSFYIKRGLVPPSLEPKTPWTFLVTINIDNNTDPDKLKQIIKALQDSIQSTS